MLNELYVSEKIACLSPPPYDESIPCLLFGEVIKLSFRFDDTPKLVIFSFGVVGCFENSYLVLGHVENHVAICNKIRNKIKLSRHHTFRPIRLLRLRPNLLLLVQINL